MSKNYIGYRPTWAEINLNNLAYNFRQLKRIVAPEVKIMVTVKADAYGHGLIPVTKRLIACGVDYLGVASIDEGINLRREKIKLPVLVLGMVLKHDIAPLFEYNLTPTVCTEDLALALNEAAKKKGKIIKIHIKVDTGMGRLGVMPQDAQTLIRRIHKLKFVNIEGIFTHLAVADTNKEFTFHQISLFNNLISKLNNQGIYIPLIHSANSMGLVGYKECHFNMVRPGLVIYGLNPKAGLNLKLKPVLSLKTQIVYLKRVPKHYGISYGHIYVTKKDTTIVTLPIGYADGYPRNLSNIAPVLIKGRRFKISGRVCMDQIMVDVGNFPVKIGDEVTLIGAQGKQRIAVEELAQLANTIPYEIVCGLGSRVPRLYI
jgi:alanine racemase